jgi:hypothetical protein
MHLARFLLGSSCSLCALALVACGGNVASSNEDAAVDGGNGGDTSSDSPTPVCPPTPPVGSSTCPRVGLTCQYGDDPRAYCNDSVTCSESGWLGGGGACPPIPTGECPPSLDAAKSMSSPCTPEGMICTYGDRICVCSSCNGPCSTTAHFWCDTAPSDTRCPSKRPMLGQSCSPEGVNCTYGVCADSTLAGRTCTGGVWVDAPMACPA